MPEEASSEAFFEAKYREAADPWNFEHSGYEHDRYAATIRALKGRRFERVFEPGCSIGVLTAELARVANQVEALETSETAAAQARKRCRLLENVNVRHGSLPGDLPGGEFDLIVFSEIGYYFGGDALKDLSAELSRRLMPNGVFVAVHWLGESADHKLTGDQVHEILNGALDLELAVRERYSGFRLDVWNKAL